MICGGFDHGFAPCPCLAEERTTSELPGDSPAAQHLWIGIQPCHQQGLAACDRLGQGGEEIHGAGLLCPPVLMVCVQHRARDLIVLMVAAANTAPVTGEGSSR